MQVLFVLYGGVVNGLLCGPQYELHIVGGMSCLRFHPFGSEVLDPLVSFFDHDAVFTVHLGSALGESKWTEGAREVEVGVVRTRVVLRVVSDGFGSARYNVRGSRVGLFPFHLTQVGDDRVIGIIGAGARLESLEFVHRGCPI